MNEYSWLPLSIVFKLCLLLRGILCQRGERLDVMGDTMFDSWTCVLWNDWECRSFDDSLGACCDGCSPWEINKLMCKHEGVR